MSRKIDALDRRKAACAPRAAGGGQWTAAALSVFRSSKQIYVQVIDDAAGK